jgi:predicted DNA binding protein
MSVVADFSIPVDAFCLGDSLEAVPSATAELDRVVAHSPDHVLPFVWLFDVDQAVFDASLEHDSSVEAWEVTDSFERSVLYHFEWTDIVSERLQEILDHEGVILNARGTTDGWRFLARFASHDHFSTFRNQFWSPGAITLHRIGASKTPGTAQYGVTNKQREALLAAYDAGYYDIPSTVTGVELAQGLGISQQSVSRRLNRGVKTLIGNTLGHHQNEYPPPF